MLAIFVLELHEKPHLFICKMISKIFSSYREGIIVIPKLWGIFSHAKYLWSYRRLPLCQFCVSRYYHLCQSDVSFLIFIHYKSLHFYSFTLSMSKTVNMKQQLSRGDFSCPKHIFYYICYCLCQSQKSALTRAPDCLLWQCTCIT